MVTAVLSVNFNPPDFRLMCSYRRNGGNSSSLGEFSLERGDAEMGSLTGGNVVVVVGGVKVVKKKVKKSP